MSIDMNPERPVTAEDITSRELDGYLVGRSHFHDPTRITSELIERINNQINERARADEDTTHPSADRRYYPSLERIGELWRRQHPVGSNDHPDLDDVEANMPYISQRVAVEVTEVNALTIAETLTSEVLSRSTTTFHPAIIFCPNADATSGRYYTISIADVSEKYFQSNLIQIVSLDIEAMPLQHSLLTNIPNVNTIADYLTKSHWVENKLDLNLNAVTAEEGPIEMQLLMEQRLEELTRFGLTVNPHNDAGHTLDALSEKPMVTMTATVQDGRDATRIRLKMTTDSKPIGETDAGLKTYATRLYVIHH